MQIQEIMSRPAKTCRPSDDLGSAARLMWECDCGAIPVTGDSGELVGMITDRDICMATYMKGAPPQSISVGEAMAKQVYSCQPHQSVEAAERMMSENQVRRIPITDSQKHLVGMLSLNDIARHAASRSQDGINRDLVQTLASIGESRRSNGHQARL